METIELSFERRTPSGKGGARKLRATERIPAVFYGPGRENDLLTLDPKRLRALVGHSFLIKLSAAGDALDGQLAMLREVQRDPVSRKLLHADLYEIQMGRELSLTVEVEIVGLAKGVDADGGTLELHLRDLEVRCLPRDIPSCVQIDVTNLEVGDVLHIGELTLPPGVTAEGDARLAVVSVVAPTIELVHDEGAEAVAAPAAGDKKETDG